MRRNLLKEAIGVEDTCRRVLSTLHEYNTAQGYTPARDGPSRAGQVRQQGRKLGAELNQAAPLAKLPPVIAKPTYSTPTKNLRAAHYITSELAGLQGKDLREKQAWLQELLDAGDLQQQEMEPNGEASGTRHNNRIVVASQNKSQAQASSPNHGPTEHSRSNRAPSKSVETIAPIILATTAGSPEIRQRLPASRGIPLGQMQRSRHAAILRRQLQELARAPKVTSRPART
jgi:hypothetical protein